MATQLNNAEFQEKLRASQERQEQISKLNEQVLTLTTELNVLAAELASGGLSAFAGAGADLAALKQMLPLLQAASAEARVNLERKLR